jgi:D-sedoheptulose 7-phosphate isomerase
MTQTTRAQLDDHRAALASVEDLLPTVDEIGRRVCDAFAAGNRLYSFGNGGSAADAQHLAAELIGRYRRERRALPALSLAVDPSVVTCIANDYSYEDVFARQVEALVVRGDIVVGFSTSGQSANVVAGLAAARAAGGVTVLFGGGDGGRAREHADFALVVPTSTTARVQEMHLLMLHLLSDIIDAWAAGESDPARPASD